MSDPVSYYCIQTSLLQTIAESLQSQRVAVSVGISELSSNPVIVLIPFNNDNTPADGDLHVAEARLIEPPHGPLALKGA